MRLVDVLLGVADAVADHREADWLPLNDVEVGLLDRGSHRVPEGLQEVLLLVERDQNFNDLLE